MKLHFKLEPEEGAKKYSDEAANYLSWLVHLIMWMKTCQMEHYFQTSFNRRAFSEWLLKIFLKKGGCDRGSMWSAKEYLFAGLSQGCCLSFYPICSNSTNQPLQLPPTNCLLCLSGNTTLLIALQRTYNLIQKNKDDRYHTFLSKIYKY